jgi:hypothetical protein
MPKLTDYLLDTEGANWGDLLASWAWLVPPQFTIWLTNRFGDLFMVLDDDSVSMLDVGSGSLQRLADNRDHFSDLIDQDDNANNWLMIPLVDKLVEGGIQIGPGECYSYVQLPVLGGDYTVQNTRVVSLAQHYKAFGPIHQQIKDLPDGTRVTFRVTN